MSKTLAGRALNYSITEKECMAIVWSIKICRIHLFGQRFTVVTDHGALQWLNSFKEGSARLLRWSLALQEYTFEVIYRPGAKHSNADTLSRYPIMLLESTHDIINAQQRSFIGKVFEFF